MVSGWGGRGVLSVAFDVKIGVKLGCCASPCVFCLFFYRFRYYIAAHTPPSHHAHTLYLALLVMFILLYADDVTLIAAFPEGLQQLLYAFGHFAHIYGIFIS